MRTRGIYSNFISVIKQILIIFILILLIPTKIYAEQTDYEYDDSGRVIRVTYEDGSYETYEYDKNGNIIETISHKASPADEDDGGNEHGDNEHVIIIIYLTVTKTL